VNNNLIDNHLFYFSDSIQQYSITCVAFDNSSKSYLFGTDKNGLLKVNREHFSHIGENEGLKKTVVNSILVGNDNILWIGSIGEGLISLRSKAFLRYDQSNQKIVSSIFGICEMENEIWLSSMNKGIFKITTKGLVETPISKYIQYSRAILYDKKRKTLWIGAEKGLYSYHNNKLQHHLLNNLQPEISVKSLYLLRDGTLAIGTEGSGLYIYDEKQFKKIKAPIPAKAYIHSLLEDDDGDLWVGTGNFAYKINLKTGKYTHFVYEFCNAYIGSMTKDNLGRIWFGTDRCVNMYDGKKFYTFNQESGLNSSIIYFVYANKSGNIWVGTNNGLNKIVSNRKGKIIQILNYNENKGFYGVECNTNACFCDKKGDMWFGTVNGLFKYRAKYDLYKKSKPLIYITDVRILNQAKTFKSSGESTKWFHLPKKRLFSYNQNNLSFDFIGIFKSSPYQIEYAYKLKGFDRNWMRLENNNITTYSNLKPGNYTFLVKAKNQDGIWSETSTYSFQIKTPLWQKWWFYFIVFALVTYSVIAIVKTREKRRTKFQKMLEKTVKERTKEITLQKEEIVLLLKEVHHRVKNNMQVINSLINLQSSFIEDKKALLLFEDCKNRIHSMALIHEKLYESKDLKNVSIQEYVSNLISHLISTYEIHKKVYLKETIDASNFSLDIIIPLGLIINEIVSNSLKHAFKETENEAENIIYFSLKPIGTKQFEMIVGDNGVGFNHALFFQEEGSLGIELIKILSEQVNGTMEILKQKGTFYRLVFSE
jgi:two-component sensor histidine kinase